MAAAMEAEVLAGDADPLVVLRGGEHLLDQLTVFVLDPVPLDQCPPRFRNATREPIANRLQLAEVEHARDGRNGVDPVRDLGVTEGLAEEAGQLRLEAGDLAAQLQPRLALVDRNAEPGKLLLSKQRRHHGKCRSGRLQRGRGHP
jgi:hypothetical protein